MPCARSLSHEPPPVPWLCRAAATAHHDSGQPPPPAIVAAVIIGIATLASAAGIAAGRKWAFAVAMTCRILDSISAILGMVVRPSAVLADAGAATLVLSIAAIVLLVRTNPRRTPRGTASETPACKQPEPSRGPTH